MSLLVGALLEAPALDDMAVSLLEPVSELDVAACDEEDELELLDEELELLELAFPLLLLHAAVKLRIATVPADRTVSPQRFLLDVLICESRLSVVVQGL